MATPASNELLIQRDAEISPADQLAVLGPYFPELHNPANMNAYFQPGNLGAAVKCLVRWKNMPGAFWAAFPFPYLIDGQKVIGGKPEASAVHAELAYQAGRPDLFGMAQDALIDQARGLGWPLLIGMTTAMQRKSMKKKGFVDLEFPVARAYWPLKISGARALLGSFLERRFSGDSALFRLFRQIAAAAGSVPLVIRARLSRKPRTLTLTELPPAELRAHQPVLEQNYWPGSRLTVWRDAEYWQNRFEAATGHCILKVDGDKQAGLAIVRNVHGELRLQDVLPPALLQHADFWPALLQYARSSGAGVLTADLYLNERFQKEAIANIQKTAPAIFRQAAVTYSVLALDEKFKFAYDPQAWAGTPMLTAGF